MADLPTPRPKSAKKRVKEPLPQRVLRNFGRTLILYVCHVCAASEAEAGAVAAAAAAVWRNRIRQETSISNSPLCNVPELFPIEEISAQVYMPRWQTASVNKRRQRS